MSKEPKPFGARVRQVREQNGVSLSMLADASGVSKAYLSELEHNAVKAPGLYPALAIASALGVPVEHLAFESEDDALAYSPAKTIAQLRRKLARILRIAKGEDTDES